MTTRRRAAIGLAALGVAGATRMASARPAGIEGTWTGVLVAEPAKLRLRLVLSAGGSATLFSLDQGATPIPGRLTPSSPDTVEVEIPDVGGRFAGKLVSADRIEGVWRQGVSALPLSFLRGEAGLPKDMGPPRAWPSPAPLTPELLDQLREVAGAPALAAAAQRRGGRTLAWATGLRRIGVAEPVGPEDRWHLGSITKSMTATLIGRMVEAGQLEWDDTIGAVLGDAGLDMRPEYGPVTLRHLASHRSGLPGNIPMGEMIRFPRTSPDPREERLAYARLALAMPPVGPAGTTFEYSNNGYVVLGAIIERRLGKSWEAAVREQVFEPLKLSSAGFGPPDVAGAAAPSGHAMGPDGALRAFPGSGPADNVAALGPAGRVHMTLQDLIRYLAAHRDKAPLLAGQTWDMLHKPPFGGDYAMGWIVRPDGLLWHNGSNTLWYAVAAFHPGEGTCAAAAANDGRATDAATAVERAAQFATLAVRA